MPEMCAVDLEAKQFQNQGVTQTTDTHKSIEQLTVMQASFERQTFYTPSSCLRVRQIYRGYVSKSGMAEKLLRDNFEPKWRTGRPTGLSSCLRADCEM
jgi:hypothetical protein